MITQNTNPKTRQQLNLTEKKKLIQVIEDYSMQ